MQQTFQFESFDQFFPLVSSSSSSHLLEHSSVISDLCTTYTLLPQLNTSTTLSSSRNQTISPFS
ncbi:hypothetical protein Hanom_Chr03g00195351 [Helianthus anomalus]